MLWCLFCALSYARLLRREISASSSRENAFVEIRLLPLKEMPSLPSANVCHDNGARRKHDISMKNLMPRRLLDEEEGRALPSPSACFTFDRLIMYQRGELNEAEDGSYHLPVCVVYLKFAHDMNRWDDSIIGRSRMVLFFLAGARISGRHWTQ